MQVPCQKLPGEAQFWGVPFETTAEEVKGDAGVRWLRQGGWGLCVRQREAGEAGFGPKPETERFWLDFGRAV